MKINVMLEKIARKRNVAFNWNLGNHASIDFYQVNFSLGTMYLHMYQRINIGHLRITACYHHHTSQITNDTWHAMANRPSLVPTIYHKQEGLSYRRRAYETNAAKDFKGDRNSGARLPLPKLIR